MRRLKARTPGRRPGYHWTKEQKQQMGKNVKISMDLRRAMREMAFMESSGSAGIMAAPQMVKPEFKV